MTDLILNGSPLNRAASKFLKLRARQVGATVALTDLLRSDLALDREEVRTIGHAISRGLRWGYDETFAAGMTFEPEQPVTVVRRDSLTVTYRFDESGKVDDAEIIREHRVIGDLQIRRFGWQLCVWELWRRAVEEAHARGRRYVRPRAPAIDLIAKLMQKDPSSVENLINRAKSKRR